MDEEDLADAAEAQKIQTSQAFAGLGSSNGEEARAGGLMGLFRADGNTMGLQLLRRMGWKDGQGIGPKVRRSARLDVGKEIAQTKDETHLFAPENQTMIRFVRKTDQKGLGHQGGTKLEGLGRDKYADSYDDHNNNNDDNDDDDNAGGADRGGRPSLFTARRSKPKDTRGAFGVGVLNDTGSDDEDPYEMGPQIRYNRVIGGDKKKKNKKASAVANPALVTAPKFVPKTSRVGNSFRRCHDGRLPLDGFVLAKLTEDMAALLSQYAPPAIPSGWVSAKDPSSANDTAQYTSTADAAKASGLDSRARAALLGETALPGKSVFDFLSASARDMLAAASGKTNLPPARGEVPEEYGMTSEEQQKALLARAPKLDRDTAAAALSRISAGPYADDEFKKMRYRRYLEHQSNNGLPPPEKAKGMTNEGFLQELNEFYNCARLFKPMTGFMASRFTTSKTMLDATGGDGAAGAELLSKPEPKPADEAEVAAQMGMFGSMTRSVQDFFPTRLLCKRFNVKAPAHSRPDNEPENSSAKSTANSWSMPTSEGEMQPAAPPIPTGTLPARGNDEVDSLSAVSVPQPTPAAVNPETNDAVEGKAANFDTLRAVFGDSDSE